MPNKYSFLFVMQMIPGRKNDGDDQCDFSFAQYDEQHHFVAFLQVIVTRNFLDGNFILLAWAEHGQGGGPFLSAPVCVTVSPVVTG